MTRYRFALGFVVGLLIPVVSGVVFIRVVSEAPE